MAAGAAIQLDRQIEQRADRAGDEHHADRNENGAETTHVKPIPGKFRAKPARFALPDPNVHDAAGPRNLEHLLW